MKLKIEQLIYNMVTDVSFNVKGTYKEVGGEDIIILGTKRVRPTNDNYGIVDYEVNVYDNTTPIQDREIPYVMVNGNYEFSFEYNEQLYKQSVIVPKINVSNNQMPKLEVLKPNLVVGNEQYFTPQVDGLIQMIPQVTTQVGLPNVVRDIKYGEGIYLTGTNYYVESNLTDNVFFSDQAQIGLTFYVPNNAYNGGLIEVGDDENNIKITISQGRIKYANTLNDIVLEWVGQKPLVEGIKYTLFLKKNRLAPNELEIYANNSLHEKLIFNQIDTYTPNNLPIRLANQSNGLLYAKLYISSMFSNTDIMTIVGTNLPTLNLIGNTSPSTNQYVFDNGILRFNALAIPSDTYIIKVGNNELAVMTYAYQSGSNGTITMNEAGLDNFYLDNPLYGIQNNKVFINNAQKIISKKVFDYGTFSFNTSILSGSFIRLSNELGKEGIVGIEIEGDLKAYYFYYNYITNEIVRDLLGTYTNGNNILFTLNTQNIVFTVGGNTFTLNKTFNERGRGRVCIEKVDTNNTSPLVINSFTYTSNGILGDEQDLITEDVVYTV